MGIIISGAAGAQVLAKNQKELENKVIVLPAKFDAREEKYHVCEASLKQDRSAVREYEDMEIVPREESEVYQPDVTLSDLETLKIRKELGSEASVLLAYLIGFMRYEAGDNVTGLDRFMQAMSGYEELTGQKP